MPKAKSLLFPARYLLMSLEPCSQLITNHQRSGWRKFIFLFFYFTGRVIDRVTLVITL